MVLNGPRVPLRPLAELCFSLQPDAHSANTVSDDLVEIVKKALCFPSKMDCDEVIKSHLDDNCVSNGPHVPLKPLDKIRQISTDLPLS